MHGEGWGRSARSGRTFSAAASLSFSAARVQLHLQGARGWDVGCGKRAGVGLRTRKQRIARRKGLHAAALAGVGRAYRPKGPAPAFQRRCDTG